MALAAGNKFGHYEILAPLGAGGMGEVYRARDTRLNRDVALKVLPGALANDAERMARFQREAQVLASLNHPNIASIYGLEESGNVRALVMELVEGQTLAKRIAGPRPITPSPSPHGRGRPAGPGEGLRGVPLPLDEALQIAQQIAQALEYAHERGIIHRDLKPANIKITPEGAVKVLDFGLAKALDPAVGAMSSSPSAAGTPLQDSPTLTAAATQAGVILGTAAYMSPEQARGKPVDRRADIWAFGCVLYETLTGRRAFEGESTTDTLASVIKSEPAWDALSTDTPESIRKLLRRCLDKDPKQRLRDIGEARITIEETLSGADVGARLAPPAGAQQAAPLRQPWRRALLWAFAGIVAGALLTGLVAWKWFPRASSVPAMHFSTVTNFAGVQAQPSLSPDGRSVAFVSNREGHYNIYVGLVTGGSLVQITDGPNLKIRPRWSPDGTKLAYARLNDSGIWDIWEVAALGGTPRRLVLNATDPAWSPDGRSLAYENTASGTIWLSDSSGQNARELTRREMRWAAEAAPSYSPDGTGLAFVLRGEGPYGELAVVDLDSGKARQLTHDGALALSPAWSPDSRFIYFTSSRGGTMNIWKIAAAGGEPGQITAGQGDDAQLDVSRDGRRIVFSTYHEHSNIGQLDLEVKPGQPTLKLLTTDPARNQLAPTYSPDGKHLAYFSNFKGAEKESIWVANSDGSNPVQLVEDERINVFPHWTADGQYLIYCSHGAANIATSEIQFRSVAVSGGSPQVVLEHEATIRFDVAPDGRLLYWGPTGRIQTFDPRGNKIATLATLPASERTWQLGWSPDGRSIAYVLMPSRQDDSNAGLWVDDFKGSPHQIFRGWVIWYARGPRDEIYVLEGKPDLNGILWRVGWNGLGLTRTSTNVPLRCPYWQSLLSDWFDVSPDGHHLATEVQDVIQANIGMIENPR